jgi:hypothetical protein
VISLITLGLIFVAGTMVGGSFEAAGVRIPAITTKSDKIGLVVVGAVTIAIGFGVYAMGSGAQKYRPTTPIVNSPVAGVSPGGPSATTLQVTHDDDPPDPSVDYQGPVTVSNHDISQPLPGVPALAAGADVILAVWNHQGIPTKQQCRDSLLTNGVTQTGPLLAGKIVCVCTAQGLIARLIILNTTTNQIRADATIWKK